MKKVFPTLLVGFIFGVLVIFQMLIHGQKIAATNISETTSKYAAFESEFTKLNGSTTQGTEIDLAKVKEPIIIINFWASWCKPCLSEFGSLKNLLKPILSVLKLLESTMILKINSSLFLKSKRSMNCLLSL